MVTSISFVIIQLPACFSSGKSQKEIGDEETPYAFVAMISSIAMFFGYLCYQYYLSERTFTAEKRIERIVEKIQNGDIRLRHVVLAELHAKHLDNRKLTADEKKELLTAKSDIHRDLEAIISPFFKKYDEGNNKYLDLTQLSLVMKDLGEKPSPKEMDIIFKTFDLNRDGKVDFEEFVDGITSFVAENNTEAKNFNDEEDQEVLDVLVNESPDDEEGDGEEEEEEDMPEDIQHMTSHEEQQRALWIRASWVCGIGTILVVLFSDPMVDVLNELGARTGIPQFYVAFVLAPLASNASEVIASFNYAQKKTSKSMAISLSALQGACCMNNTFVLGIFMICVYTQSLAWQFFAETLSILVSVVFISIMSFKSTHTMFDALLILLVYPLSLVLVYVLEANGFD